MMIEGGDIKRIAGCDWFILLFNVDIFKTRHVPLPTPGPPLPMHPPTTPPISREQVERRRYLNRLDIENILYCSRANSYVQVIDVAMAHL